LLKQVLVHAVAADVYSSYPYNHVSCASYLFHSIKYFDYVDFVLL